MESEPKEWTLSQGETVKDHDSDSEYENDSEWTPDDEVHVFKSSFKDANFNFDQEMAFTHCHVDVPGNPIVLIDWKKKAFKLVCSCDECLGLPLYDRVTRPTYYLSNSDGHTYLNFSQADLYNLYE